jgi:hypothetical protein
MSTEPEHVDEHGEPGINYDEFLFKQRSDGAEFPKGLTPVNGWSASGNILVPSIPFPDGIYSPQGEAKVQVAFPKPGYHTIQFSINQLTPALDDTPLNPLVVRPQAEIIWTTKGNGIRRLIDVSDGTSISGTGESVYVRVTDNSFFNTTTDSNYEYSVGISVTPGTRPNTAGSQPPVKNAEHGFYGVDAEPGFFAGATFEITNAGTATLTNLTNIVIPQNCGINSYYLDIVVNDPAGLTPVGGQIQIVQDGGGPGISQPISRCNYDQGVGKWIALSPGAKLIQILNGYESTATPTLFGTILFGVDG